MEVVLLEDIKGLGTRGDVCVVRDGYAMNCLIPQKKAAEKTGEQGKNIAAQKAAQKEQHAEKIKKESAIFERIPSEITIPATVNEQDTLFQAVTAETLIQHLKEQGIDALVSWFPPVAIKETGTHVITINCGDTKKPLTVTVAKST